MEPESVYRLVVTDTRESNGNQLVRRKKDNDIILEITT